MNDYDEVKLLKKIKILLDDAIETQIDAKLDEKIGKLPTKEEFYSRMDEMMGEIKTAREEQSVLSQHDRDQFDAIEALQKIHPHNSHAAFA